MERLTWTQSVPPAVAGGCVASWSQSMSTTYPPATAGGADCLQQRVRTFEPKPVNAVKLISRAGTLKLFILICCVLTYAQSAELKRQRMLIGENDPLTGYKILRARYEAGARPSDDMDGWALSYLLTGDETYAKRAVQKMRETHTPEQVGSRTY